MKNLLRLIGVIVTVFCEGCILFLIETNKNFFICDKTDRVKIIIIFMMMILSGAVALLCFFSSNEKTSRR